MKKTLAKHWTGSGSRQEQADAATEPPSGLLTRGATARPRERPRYARLVAAFRSARASRALISPTGQLRPVLWSGQ